MVGASKKKSPSSRDVRSSVYKRHENDFISFFADYERDPIVHRAFSGACYGNVCTVLARLYSGIGSTTSSAILEACMQRTQRVDGDPVVWLHKLSERSAERIAAVCTAYQKHGRVVALGAASKRGGAKEVRAKVKTLTAKKKGRSKSATKKSRGKSAAKKSRGKSAAKKSRGKSAS